MAAVLYCNESNSRINFHATKPSDGTSQLSSTLKQTPPHTLLTLPDQQQPQQPQQDDHSRSQLQTTLVPFSTYNAADLPLTKTHATSPSTPKVNDFGAPGGVPISNLDDIMQTIDAALGVNHPPAIEFIFVEPYTSVSIPKFPNWGFSNNPYGHAAVRYTLPDGQQILMNIVRTSDQMVNFMSPAEYLYGTTSFDKGSEQGGVYNRHMIGVRLEEWPPELVQRMHEYYVGLQERNASHTVKYSLLFSHIFNALSFMVAPFLFLAERGNCARFSSMGLVQGKIVRSPSLWPKSIWVDILETHGRMCPGNVHVVSYERVKHAYHSYGLDAKPLSSVAPGQSLGNLLYFNTKRFADVVVEVPVDSRVAVVRKTERPSRPSFFGRIQVSFVATVALSSLCLVWALIKNPQH
eukprot:TRINITY_DN715_c4_g1_i1.p1 TRINITY_DN715_c4_g1~~TRINITY_DN715_c4_g1_i1.p1  ORF type:complete len:407 (-),score=67.59 TRINITY_DN715_c4_g1_i1:33-1253(-)